MTGTVRGLRHGVDLEGARCRTWLTARAGRGADGVLPVARFALHRLVR